jgi:hypothetical protein
MALWTCVSGCVKASSAFDADWIVEALETIGQFDARLAFWSEWCGCYIKKKIIVTGETSVRRVANEAAVHHIITAFTSCKIANSHWIKASLAISTVAHLVASHTSEHFTHVALESAEIDKIAIDAGFANRMIGTWDTFGNGVATEFAACCIEVVVCGTCERGAVEGKDQNLSGGVADE